MVFGPLVDPPFPQHEYRPEGVYLYPDPRAGMDGRTVVELWGHARECLYCGSVLSRLVTPELQVRLWAFCDMAGDPRMAVNDTISRQRPGYLSLTR